VIAFSFLPKAFHPLEIISTATVATNELPKKGLKGKQQLYRLDTLYPLKLISFVVMMIAV